MSQWTGLRSARRQLCGQAGRTDSKCLRSCVLGTLRNPWQGPVLGESRPPRPCSGARFSLAGLSFGRRSEGQLRPPERRGWGTRLSSHQGRPAWLTLRLGPAAPLGCGSALQPPAPRCGRGSWAGGRSGRAGGAGGGDRRLTHAFPSSTQSSRSPRPPPLLQLPPLQPLPRLPPEETHGPDPRRCPADPSQIPGDPCAVQLSLLFLSSPLPEEKLLGDSSQTETASTLTDY